MVYVVYVYVFVSAYIAIYNIRGVGARAGAVRLINIHKFSSSEPQPYYACAYSCCMYKGVLYVHAAVAGTEISRHGSTAVGCTRELRNFPAR